jgi:peptidoglycan-associated lipoprotein
MNVKGFFMKRSCLLFLFGVLFFSVGCAKKQIIANDGESVNASAPASQKFSKSSDMGDAQENSHLKVIRFAFDKSILSEEAKSILKSNADYLISNRRINVVVEGHTDSVGTIEYNLALGDRRAKKVKDFYIGLGIASKRISTISYGEEKPADASNTKAASAKNRRAETKVLN